MTIVAVAGGSGSAKKPQDGVQYLPVNYANVEATGKALEENKIGTVISAMSVMSPEVSAAQVNLVKAAQKSNSTRRFVVSAYDMMYTRDQIPEYPPAQYAFEAVDALDQTDLEYTRVANGFLSDYYGMPHYKTNLQPWTNFVNLEKKWATIPGDGSAKAHYTTSWDVARYVARLMDLEKWTKVSSICIETLSISEVLALAEKTRGPGFEVVYDDLEKLKSGKVTLDNVSPDYGVDQDEAQAMYAKIHYYAATGKYLVPTEDSLTSKFPEIVPKTVAQVMEESWQGK
ncbi:hypothetical protein CH063_03078 [Colletotrichum higginsianum]|uniref:NmrA-like domain-containing protein n=1 Tax=Colletotrichum higginsianum (strain IMI 349063) TaxID=759273 RepID=H1VT99_COLHI|nr:hypothetical protein CH063_03078 [Colletotrichum higginsianum]